MRRLSSKSILARETEIKLVSTPRMLDLLKHDARFAGGAEEQALVSTYFDTADHRLATAGVRLRVRANGQKLEQTMKRAHLGSATVVTQIEQNCRADREEPDLSAYPASTCKALERIAGGRAFVPLARTIVDREMRMIRHRGSRIELAFDR